MSVGYTTSSSLCTINTSLLHSGVYIVTFTVGDKTINKKIIKK